jgi:hypothetical protein
MINNTPFRRRLKHIGKAHHRVLAKHNEIEATKATSKALLELRLKLQGREVYFVREVLKHPQLTSRLLSRLTGAARKRRSFVPGMELLQACHLGQPLHLVPFVK